MRTLLRAGAIALATCSTLLGAAVAAQAAPTGAVTVKVSQLILHPGKFGHTGTVRVVIRNPSSEPFSGSVTITEVLPSTTGTIVGSSGCGLGSTPDNRTISSCHLDEDIAPGGTRVVTIDFRSPAKPQPYAQVAPQRGSVEVGGVTAGFSAVFRSTTGSLRNPRPYVQDTTAALTVTAPDVTLTRQADGTFAGRVPVTIRNNSDAPHYELGADILTPEILNWPDIEPVGVCVNSGELPVPAGSAGIGCQLSGDQIAEGQVRTFHWLLTAPSETPVGPLGTGTTLVKLAGPAAAQTDAANIDSFNITVAG